MSRREQMTRARLVDGKVLIRQADGTFREEAGLTDWDRVATFTEEEIERMATEDGEGDAFPPDAPPARVVRTRGPVE